MKTIMLEVELTEPEAYTLAQLCKRILFNDVKTMAVDKDEEYRMIWTTTRVLDALAESGVRMR